MDDQQFGDLGGADAPFEIENAGSQALTSNVVDGEGAAGFSSAAVPTLTSVRGGIVTARGTGDGLVVRLDGRVDGSSLKEALLEFLNSRKGFLAGNEVALEWVGVLPAQALINEISALLDNEFGISVRSSELWEQPLRSVPNTEDGSRDGNGSRVEGRGTATQAPRRLEAANSSSAPAVAAKRAISPRGMKPVTSGRAPSLFDGIEAFSGVMEEESVFADEVASQQGAAGRANLSVDGSLWDDPNARMVYSTIRSGQKIETEHSLVIFGDVNSGAELIAGGDIIVLGSLRGTAHAGAYDETGGGRVIFALNLQPTQLRIGMTISRGSSEMGSAPELARVEGNLIVVEPYSSRQNWGRRR